MTHVESSSPELSRTTGAADRPWHMRAWSGITVSGWWRALREHSFRVSPSRIPMASLLSGMSLLNSTLAGIQNQTYGRQIAETELAAPPIFVVGHWRAGTTLLHELLVLDAAFTYPNTYACFSPNHFLVSEAWLKRMIGVFLPRQRPMDNMAIGWDLPQEDEWALCNMGLPSPYRKIMFPNMAARDADYLTLQTLDAQARSEWQSRFKWLLKSLTLREPKPIVLKTPVHTARVAALLELFPQARFIHISRNPYVVYPSTLHTWRRMYRYHGLQVPRFAQLEEEVMRTYEEMYAAFERDKQLIPSDQFYQLSYEDLAAKPVSQLEKLYRHFNFPVTPQVLNGWQAYAQRSQNYQTNRYQVSASERDEIGRRWATYFEEYGYDPNGVA